MDVNYIIIFVQLILVFSRMTLNKKIGECISDFFSSKSSEGGGGFIGVVGVTIVDF